MSVARILLGEIYVGRNLLLVLYECTAGGVKLALGELQRRYGDIGVNLAVVRCGAMSGLVERKGH